MLHMPITSFADVSQLWQYIFNKNSLQSSMWPTALEYTHSTSLVYALEQICLPHCTCMSDCTSVVYILTPHYCIYPLKINNYNIYLPYYYKILTNNKCTPQMSKISHLPILLDMHIWGKNSNIYICHIWKWSHQWCSQNHCTHDMYDSNAGQW